MPWMKTQLSVVCGSDAVPRVPKFLFGPDGGQTQLYFDNTEKKGHINPTKDLNAPTGMRQTRCPTTSWIPTVSASRLLISPNSHPTT